MSQNPLDRVAEQLSKVLPASTAPSTPHLSGAETPPPFAWGGNTTGGLSPAEPATPASGKRRTRLAVLTSGGDSAGMNAAVRAVVKMAIARCVLAPAFSLDLSAAVASVQRVRATSEARVGLDDLDEGRCGAQKGARAGSSAQGRPEDSLSAGEV